ncbi:hypothetical protein N7478_010850 [Penicillium angulare]|uniref:uncharacterized protein n=1 Tax=Penicillium angulare TaxID=116970 RepID=UPI002541480F|nr:uncharacterized protein N7478_010850 [Penicillium angulare]KAJ5263245.1 hypothetical protein N7478_010850 [Penicillium angulare]
MNISLSIPAIFESRKNKILQELSVPDEEYTDLSPKGSVDEGIRDLIRDINTLPGLVTTSSCAGRISVFLEGRKKTATTTGDESLDQDSASASRQFVPSGGKGTGRWLYVSHDPFVSSDNSAASSLPLHEKFGLSPGDGRPPNGKALRLVRFHFEPLILHIMAASLHHAQPVLSAASTSGFRESGLQSLRCLEGEEGPSPIVAVRSSGLSLESVIGYCDDNDDEGGDEPVIRSLVSEEYLQMLIAMSNERFEVNAERKERFRAGLLDAVRGKVKPDGWEDPVVRRERKKAEGLAKKRAMEERNSKGPAGQVQVQVPEDLEIGAFGERAL